MNRKCAVLFVMFLGIFLLSCSSNQKGAAITYRHFNVIEQDGKVAATEPIPADPTPLWAQEVSQRTWDWSNSSDAEMPYLKEPMPFVIPPKEGAGELFYTHNHCPSITWLNNGDLCAIWYSTDREGEFVLGSGCALPRYSKKENLLALNEAAIEYGIYP